MKPIIFKKGDIVIQKITNPNNIDKKLVRNGIITKVGKHVIHIQWIPSEEIIQSDVIIVLKQRAIKMIFDKTWIYRSANKA